MRHEYSVACRKPVASILDSKRRIFANKENLGKENSLQRKGCKESKENIGNKSLILHLFQRKIANIMKKTSNLKFFENIVA